MKRALNPARMAEGATARVLGLCLLWLGLTQAYRHYVTPRTLPYLYFAAAALGAAGVYDLTRMFEAAHVRRYTHLLALLIPLLLLTASISAEGLWDSPLFPDGSGASESPLLFEQTLEMKAAGYEGRVIHGYDAANRTITVLPDETYFWLTEIYTDPTPFLGFTITTTGQVMKNSSYFGTDCFAAVRQLMTCCVADLYSVGFKCQYDQAQALSEDDWVTVTGTLAMADAAGGQELRVLVSRAEACQAPEEPYVYAY
jgi:putative membrane protein